MATENELRDLRERIGRLSGDEQVWLLEAALADNRKKYEETLAWMAASEKAFLEAEKRRRETTEPVPPAAKREAG
jgi:hypothetical protein